MEGGAVMKAKRAAALFVLLALFALAAFFATRSRENIGTMEVYVFGIGRADAILIKTENHAVMIDTGENQHGEYLAGRLSELGVERLDYLVITHFDSDHVGGAHVIVNRFEIGEVIVPDYTRSSRHVERFHAAVANAGLTPHILKAPRRFTLDGAVFLFDPSGLDAIGDDASIVAAVSHGDNHFLFTGDAANDRLEEILANGELMAFDFIFLKVPRHGRHTRNAVELILSVQPRYAVITGFHSADADKYYPERPADERVVDALEYVGAEIFFTMSEGVRFTSNPNGTLDKKGLFE
jgi:beta-lactamase superfamily II metal-dependent hydrolase